MADPTQVGLSWAATFVDYEETLYGSIFMDDSRAAVKVKAQVGKPANGFWCLVWKQLRSTKHCRALKWSSTISYLPSITLSFPGACRKCTASQRAHLILPIALFELLPSGKCRSIKKKKSTAEVIYSSRPKAITILNAALTTPPQQEPCKHPPASAGKCHC